MTKKLLSLLVGIVFTLFASLAHAVPPQNGWWWNPAESGSGYAIERQGNSIFMASFLYESSGAATWYVSSLTLGPDGSYQGDMLRYTGGKSLLGSYKPPTSPTAIAAVAISFQTADTGTMVITFPNGAPSRTITIYRFGFGTPTAFVPSNGSFQSGWYWNAAESGTGYFVEVQGNQAFIASFMYDTAGQPTWYVSVANLQGSNGLSGSLTKYINGQSVGGTYKAPTISGDAGVVSYSFATGSSGTMKLPNGASVPITRFGFDSTYTTNTPPIANAGSNQSVTVGTRVSLDGSGTDSNGENLNYYWSYLAAPANSEASLFNWATANPYFTPDQAGTYQFGLTVDDGKASSSLALVTINAINTNTSSNGCAPATYTPNLPPMIDSLGNPVDESFGGGDAGAVGADGTAGDGAPIANAPVTITDANGKTVSTTTDALGYYRVSLKCMTPPFIAKVVREDGSTWMSGSTSSPIQRGFVTMNITGLTDKVLGYVADAAKVSGGSDGVTPSILVNNISSFNNAKEKISVALTAPLTYVGINPQKFDPVVTPFKAIYTDLYDNLLEQLVFNKDIAGNGVKIIGTFAGNGQSYIDGLGDVASFNRPGGMVYGNNGEIYLIDSYNSAIRKMELSSSGKYIVTTFAFGKKYNKFLNFRPDNFAIDSYGNLFVTSGWSYAILKITPNGVISEFAYPKGRGEGYSYFGEISIDKNNNIFVAVGPNDIYKISPEGVGALYLSAYSGNPPKKFVIDALGNSYFGDGSSIWKVTPLGAKSIIYNAKTYRVWIDQSDNIYYTDTAGDLYKINSFGVVVGSIKLGSVYKINTAGVAFDMYGNLFVSDWINNSIFKIFPSGNFLKIAGQGAESGHMDGLGPQARFGFMAAINNSKSGDVYISERNKIRKISPSGVVKTIDYSIYYNGGIVSDQSGFLYVGTNGHGAQIRRIRGGVSEPFVGMGASGFKDGNGSQAQFSNYILGLAFDSKGNLFATDFINNAIRKITPSGDVTTFAGGSSGFINGLGSASSFNGPFGLAIDDADNIYVSDTNNHAIRKITPAGKVSTFAGGLSGSGFVDGSNIDAKFKRPHGIALDKYNNLYVADHDNSAIRKITPSGSVTTVAGDGTQGYLNGSSSVARLRDPWGVTIMFDDVLLVIDSGNYAVRIILP